MQDNKNCPKRICLAKDNLSYNSDWSIWNLCQIGTYAQAPGPLRRSKRNLIFELSNYPIRGRMQDNVYVVRDSYVWIFLSSIHHSGSNMTKITIWKIAELASSPHHLFSVLHSEQPLLKGRTYLKDFGLLHECWSTLPSTESQRISDAEELKS